MRELLVIPDVVGLVVSLAGKHGEHAIGREMGHLAPDARAEKQALPGPVQVNANAISPVIESEGAGTPGTMGKLPEFAVCVPAPIGGRAVKEVEPLHRKRRADVVQIELNDLEWYHHSFPVLNCARSSIAPHTTTAAIAIQMNSDFDTATLHRRRIIRVPFHPQVSGSSHACA